MANASTTQEHPPTGWFEQQDGTLACPHRNLSVCQPCADAHDECVDVVGAHFWVASAADRVALAAEMAQ